MMKFYELIFLFRWMIDIVIA